MLAVSDSSPLIALQQIGQLDLLRSLFQEILIPSAVAAEIRQTVIQHPWIRLRPLSGPLSEELRRPALGPGEREALSLAVEVRADALLVDDQAARRIAGELGLPVIGTGGVLLMAKERGLIAEVRTHLEALLSQHFFLSAQVYELILRKAGEL